MAAVFCLVFVIIVLYKGFCGGGEIEQIEWLLCPVCGRKTRIKVCVETVLVNFLLLCPKCNEETLIDVQKQVVSVINKPDTAI